MSFSGKKKGKRVRLAFSPVAGKGKGKTQLPEEGAGVITVRRKRKKIVSLSSKGKKRKGKPRFVPPEGKGAFFFGGEDRREEIGHFLADERKGEKEGGGKLSLKGKRGISEGLTHSCLQFAEGGGCDAEGGGKEGVFLVVEHERT